MNNVKKSRNYYSRMIEFDFLDDFKHHFPSIWEDYQIYQKLKKYDLIKILDMNRKKEIYQYLKSILSKNYPEIFI